VEATNHQTTNKQQDTKDSEQQEDAFLGVHSWFSFLFTLVLCGQDLLRVLSRVHGIDLLFDL
jgi:hypothetical protein